MVDRTKYDSEDTTPKIDLWQAQLKAGLLSVEIFAMLGDSANAAKDQIKVLTPEDQLGGDQPERDRSSAAGLLGATNSRAEAKVSCKELRVIIRPCHCSVARTRRSSASDGRERSLVLFAYPWPDLQVARQTEQELRDIAWEFSRKVPKNVANVRDHRSSSAPRRSGQVSSIVWDPCAPHSEVRAGAEEQRGIVSATVVNGMNVAHQEKISGRDQLGHQRALNEREAQEQQLIIEQQAQMLDFLEREMASFKAEVLRLKRRRDARRAGHEPSLHAHRRAMACDFKRGRRKQLSPGIL
eukprot:symbB.v1.2.027004.t1/scaffold2737.1/size71945/2